MVSDIYSFEEEEAVLDPHISDHISHFGIDMLQMQKRVRRLCCEGKSSDLVFDSQFHTKLCLALADREWTSQGK